MGQVPVAAPTRQNLGEGKDYDIKTPLWKRHNKSLNEGMETNVFIIGIVYKAGLIDITLGQGLV